MAAACLEVRAAIAVRAVRRVGAACCVNACMQSAAPLLPSWSLTAFLWPSCCVQVPITAVKDHLNDSGIPARTA